MNNKTKFPVRRCKNGRHSRCSTEQRRTLLASATSLIYSLECCRSIKMRIIETPAYLAIKRTIIAKLSLSVTPHPWERRGRKKTRHNARNWNDFLSIEVAPPLSTSFPLSRRSNGLFLLAPDSLFIRFAKNPRCAPSSPFYFWKLVSVDSLCLVPLFTAVLSFLIGRPSRRNCLFF